MKQTHALPTVLVIYGATGDLVAKKIVPALFNLFGKGKLPPVFHVIGFARRDLAQEVFQSQISDIVTTHYGTSVDAEKLKTFVAMFRYHRGDFTQLDAYHELATELGRLDGEWKTCSNKLFYLAVPPESYKTIFEHLSDSGLTIPCEPDEGWTRIIVEKPIGRDAKTAEDLDMLIGSLFKEEQIYRIDHYLAKEMVQNILTFRFSNNLFESAWSNATIESIHVRLLETLGVEKRGAFYDSLGTLRDVGQNHLLQMLAFATMDHPESFEADAVRVKRAEVLNTLKPMDEAEITEGTYRAQYAGYREIPGVQPDSQIETYFRIRAELEAPRWKGVPITLESGKRMGEARKEITIHFKHPMPCLCPDKTKHLINKVTFGIEPEERIMIRFWAKKPGLDFEIEERSFDFLLRDQASRTQYVEEYEKLLLDCIQGDQTLFISTDEVKAMWRYTDPIVEAWTKGIVPLGTYTPDTHEARDASAFIETK